ncbi:uncharacterized protein LOC131659204 [Vicia villosa]|uniref:uncharacterized protein LOC131659204 n=1 Tax=Vicia villosa TaxID=3911 RepID=UPI00273C7758|nr:uncharacterized protein LOC131659204 [Vicia villosa]
MEKCTFGVRAGKFLGFYLTERGIEANPDKCRAFSEFPTPNDKKSIQVLNGMLTVLSRFVAKSAQHALPFFKPLLKEATFEWFEECEQALSHLKQVLSEPPVLTRPGNDEILYLYLAVSNEAISAALIQEAEDGQKPVYFTSKALQRPEYESRKALEAQALADFIAEMTSITSPPSAENKWTIYVDGASSNSGSGAGIILENDEGLIIEVSLVLLFTTSNNQAEYEAFLASLRLAEDVGSRQVKIYADSQLVASQVNGDYQTKNDTLVEYLALVKEKMKNFAKEEVEHIPQEHNSRADVLSKLASTRNKGGNKSVIQEILSKPSVDRSTSLIQVLAIRDDQCWMTHVYNFLTKDELPADAKEASTIKRRAYSYVIIENKLYR